MKALKLLLLTAAVFFACATVAAHVRLDDLTYAQVAASRPALGDVVFTRIGGPLFAQVADATGTWASHVGIIVDFKDGDWIVAESGIPFVRKTPLRIFLGRSSGGKFAILRLKQEPTEPQTRLMLALADAQMGRVYDLGFNLESQRTFCSKFVHDVVLGSTHQSLGEVETFDHLLHSNPHPRLWFWRAWFLGRVPWDRTTITPASELKSPLLKVVTQHSL